MSLDQPPMDTAPPSARPPAPKLARLAVVLAIGALAVALVAWLQSHQALEELRAARTERDEAALRNAPVLDLAGAPALGSNAAKVALIEFSDYECPYCIRHFRQTMPQIDANYVKTGKIRYVFRDWPVDQLHPQAIGAHQAAHCAAEQNRFWDLHARLFGPAGSHAPAQLMALAAGIGLDERAFSACLSSERHTPAIRTTSQFAMDHGATGTPAFFLGLRDPATEQVTITGGLAGAQPYEEFARAIDGMLERAR